MQRVICKSKLHRATVTDANVDYTGSLSIDSELMKAAGLVPYEQVHVVDIENGARLITYAIEGEPGSGTICANGAAAHLIGVGDKVIIIAYANVDEDELDTFHPKVVLLDENNKIRDTLNDDCKFTQHQMVEGKPVDEQVGVDVSTSQS